MFLWTDLCQAGSTLFCCGACPNTVQGWLCIIFACLCAVKISLRVGCASAAVQSFGRRPWAVALPIVLLRHVASRLGSAVQIRQMCKGPLQFPGTNHACWSVVLMQALLWLPSSIDLHFGSANGSAWSDLFCEATTLRPLWRSLWQSSKQTVPKIPFADPLCRLCASWSQHVQRKAMTRLGEHSFCVAQFQ